MTPNRAAIRQLLYDAFNDEELTTFCFDHFPDVYNSFGAGMSKGDKTLRLLDYAFRHDEVGALLSAVREANPAQYRKYAAGQVSGLTPDVSAPDGSPADRPASSATADREGLEAALRMARRRLAILEEQVAGFGKLYAPAHLQIELEEARAEVARLREQMGGK